MDAGGDITSSASAFELCSRLVYPRFKPEVRRARFERLLRDRGIGTPLTKAERAARALEAQGDLPPIPLATLTRRHECATVEIARKVTCAELERYLADGNAASLQFFGEPGLGKTRSAGESLLRALADRIGKCALGMAALALPTRQLSAEKARAMQEAVSRLGLEFQVEVRLALGRSEFDDGNGFRCRDFAGYQRRKRRYASGCGGCELADDCKTTDGQFRKDWRDAGLDRPPLPGEPARLYITTIALAKTYLKRAAGPIVIDDDGEMSIFGPAGVVEEIRVSRDERSALRDHVLAYLDGDGRAGSALCELREWAATKAKVLATLSVRLEEAFHDVDDERIEADVEAFLREIGVRIDADARNAVKHAAKSFTKHGRDGLVGSVGAYVRQVYCVPDRGVAGLLHELLGDREVALVDRIRRVARELDADVREALLGWLIAPPYGRSWSFDLTEERNDEQDDEDLRLEGEDPEGVTPAALRLLRILREVVDGGDAVVVEVQKKREDGALEDNEEPKALIAFVASPMLEYIRNGRVVMLAVHPPVSMIAERTGLEVVEVSFRSRNLHVVAIALEQQEVRGAGAVRARALGAGAKKARPDRKDSPRTKGGVSYDDVVFRSFARKLVVRHAEGRPLAGVARPRGLAVIAHKQDHIALDADGLEQLGRELTGNDAVLVGHFGADSSSTDRFRDCGVVLARRFALGPAELARRARALRSAFRVLPPSTGEDDDELVARVSHWGEGGPAAVVWVPRDPLAAEIDELVRGAALVNAAGRLRAPARPEEQLLAVVACGAPVRALEVDEVLDEAGCIQRLGIDPTPRADELREAGVLGRLLRAAEWRDLQRRFAELVREGRLSCREQVARELGCSLRQVDKLSKIWRVGEGGRAVGEIRPEVVDPLVQRLRAALGDDQFLPLRQEYYSLSEGVKSDHPREPTREAIAAELRRRGRPLSPASIGRALVVLRRFARGEVPVLPRQARSVASLCAVAEAIQTLRVAATSSPEVTAKPESKRRAKPRRKPRKRKSEDGGGGELWEDLP